MRLLVDELPETKEKCPFYRSKVWADDCTLCKVYCTLLRDSCDLNIKTGCRTTCSGLSIITDSRVMRYD